MIDFVGRDLPLVNCSRRSRSSGVRLTIYFLLIGKRGSSWLNKVKYFFILAVLLPSNLP